MINSYEVRNLRETDVEDIYKLCLGNELYYKYCPPPVTEESILADMNALPPNKSKEDKHYIGFYDKDKLIAVIDLIDGFPDDKTAFIGFFMTDTSVQNNGVGSRIITELCEDLYSRDFSFVRLGWVKGNPQAEHFWKKNGFAETGETSETEEYKVVLAQRKL